MLKRQYRDRLRCRNGDLRLFLRRSIAPEKKQADRNCYASDNNIEPSSTTRTLSCCISHFGALDPLRCRFKTPRDHQRDRKSEHDEKHEQTNDPIRDIEDRKDLRNSLSKRPPANRVGDCHFVNKKLRGFTWNFPGKVFGKRGRHAKDPIADGVLKVLA